MAQVAVMLSHVWHCPHCETVIKARRYVTTAEAAERHLMDKHNVFPLEPGPFVERCHWAFNIRP